MINLNILHNTHNILHKRGSYGRQFGKTTYMCYLILGYLEVLENETITVLLEKEDRLFDISKKLNEIFEENDLKPIYEVSSRRLHFENNSNNIKFITLDILKRNHPTDFSPSYNVNLIHDLEGMSSHFYNEEISIWNCKPILDKYLKQREV